MAITQEFRNAVDAAGRALTQTPPRTAADLQNTLMTVNNWRSLHAFPLNTMRIYLRKKAMRVDPNSLVAQRMKRLSSIEAKLRRFEWLQLSEMQDIGGCRSVVGSVAHVEQLVADYHKSQIKHKLVDSDDYIAEPKASGYRGYHLIYEYNSDKKTTYNGLKIEIQIRSRLQHIWATAVETVGTFTQQALKSSQGEREWLRFFALMSSLFAAKEKRPGVPGTPRSGDEQLGEIGRLATELDVVDRLLAYRAAVRAAKDPSMPAAVRYYLLELNMDAKTITITGFRSNQVNEASAAYLEAEKKLNDARDGDAVLVSAESVDSLRRAYPNYFLDTSRFRREVERALRAGAEL